MFGLYACMALSGSANNKRWWLAPIIHPRCIIHPYGMHMSYMTAFIQHGYMTGSSQEEESVIIAFHGVQSARFGSGIAVLQMLTVAALDKCSRHVMLL